MASSSGLRAVANAVPAVSTAPTPSSTALKYAITFDDVAEILGYKYVIEESQKCEKIVKELKEKKN